MASSGLRRDGVVSTGSSLSSGLIVSCVDRVYQITAMTSVSFSQKVTNDGRFSSARQLDVDNGALAGFGVSWLGNGLRIQIWRVQCVVSRKR